MSAASLGAGTPAWLEDSTADVPAELLADADSEFLDVNGLVVHYKEATPSAASYTAGLSSNDSQPLALPDTATLAVKQHQQQHAASVMHAGGVAAAGKESHTAAGISPQLPPVAEISVAATAAGIDAAAGVRPDVAIVLIHGFGGGVFAWRHMQQPLADAVGVRVIAFDRPGFGECYLLAGLSLQTCLAKRGCAWCMEKCGIALVCSALAGFVADQQRCNCCPGHLLHEFTITQSSPCSESALGAVTTTYR